MEINDYPNYLIYEDGRVWSKTSNKYIKQNLYGKYIQITLHNNSKPKTFNIHRLIGLYYIPNPNNKPEVDHINRIKHDNRIENLRWATSSEQKQNRDGYSNTGEKYITKTYRKDNNKFYYFITKNDYFNKKLSCNKWTLQDAIKLRDELLIEYEIVELSV